MAVNYEEMPNEALVTIAHMQNHEACSEVLKRNIMAVDNVEYDEACEKFKLIAAKNREGMLLAALPYQIGFGLAGTAAFLSIPSAGHMAPLEQPDTVNEAMRMFLQA